MTGELRVEVTLIREPLRLKALLNKLLPRMPEGSDWPGKRGVLIQHCLSNDLMKELQG